MAMMAIGALLLVALAQPGDGAVPSAHVSVTDGSVSRVAGKTGVPRHKRASRPSARKCVSARRGRRRTLRRSCRTTRKCAAARRDRRRTARRSCPSARRKGAKAPRKGARGPGSSSASAGATPSAPTPAIPGSSSLVWSDEFKGRQDRARIQPSGLWRKAGASGAEAKNCRITRRGPSNVSLDGKGDLVITARKENYGGFPYTSARVETQGKFSFTYGRIEARMKLPEGQGIYPIFWLLGSNINEVRWPTSGEIDVMESRGQYPSTFMGHIHGPEPGNPELDANWGWVKPSSHPRL